MQNVDQIRRMNFRTHLLEGALYIGSGALLSPQTIIPALLARLGAGNLAIGVLPVVVYLFFYLPQLIAADRVTRVPFRKPVVLRLGLVQRLHIALLASVVFIAGGSHPTFVLIVFFILYASNQLWAGMGSPAWYDFTVKTIDVSRRGILMGLRVSSGSAIGFINGMVVSVVLTTLAFPANYGLIIAIGFLFQLSSLLVQRRVVEWAPSTVGPATHTRHLLARAKSVLASDHVFRRFLISSTFLVIGFSGVGFFMVSALRGLRAPESAVGLFTILTIGAQILSGVSLGFIADRFGNKAALVVTALSLAAAEMTAALAGSVAVYAAVFVLAGVNLGAEIAARYNFTAECASPEDRPFYVGMMNAWLAPWYLCSILAGWASDQFGYRAVFIACASAAFIGFLLLLTVPSPRSRHLAVSSK